MINCRVRCLCKFCPEGSCWRTVGTVRLYFTPTKIGGFIMVNHPYQSEADQQLTLKLRILAWQASSDIFMCVSLLSNGHRGGALSLGIKRPGAWSWPFTSMCRGQIMRGAIPPPPNKPSWRGAQLKSTGTSPLPFAQSPILHVEFSINLPSTTGGNLKARNDDPEILPTQRDSDAFWKYAPHCMVFKLKCVEIWTPLIPPPTHICLYGVVLST